MASIAEWVRELGGMAQKRQLVRRGATDRDLTLAVRNASVIRARNGWYSTLDETDPRLRAVRVGGRLTGLALIASSGGWVLKPPPLHVSLARNAARMRTQQNRRRRLNVQDTRGVVLHWESESLTERGTATDVSLIDALHRVILDESLEDAVAALDWALHSDILDPADLEHLILGLPQHLRWIADWVDALCESLPESLSRTRLRLAGHSVVSQVELGETERIDLVIDGIVGLEVDGEEFHVNRFEQDRGKDLRMTIAKYHSIRPSARLVFNQWSSVERAIETALAARGAPLAISMASHGTRRSCRDRMAFRGGSSRQARAPAGRERVSRMSG